MLASDQVLAVATDDGRARYTSREMHDVEERFVDAVTRRDGRRSDRSERGGGGDRRRGRRSATTRPPRCRPARCVVRAALSVLIGPAGTGKTYTLDTVRDAYEQAGWRVIGAGPSARAAQELTAGAGIPARTLHALLGDVDRGLE